jgi:polysaccharide chain length determinant protein (PEP-CTERM system associated)
MGAPQNYVSVSRRPPDVEDYIDMLRRYRSWIVGPMFAGLVISVVVAFLWPDTFVSSALMQITPQLVSSRLVPNDVTQLLSDRLTQMEEEILSRSSLTELITRPSLNLYPKERSQKPLEDIVQDMRKNIKIGFPELGAGGGSSDRHGVGAFLISFRYTDRYKCQNVVRELVSKFTEQNIQVQRRQAHLTTEFLDDEYKAAKERMDDLDQKIARFKIENQGKLPEQFQSNVTAEQSLQTEANRVNDSISQHQGQKAMLEQQLDNLISEQQFYSTRSEDSIAGASPTAVKNQQLINLEAQLSKYRSDLAAARKIYGEAYPEIGSIKAQIEQLEQQKAELEKQQMEQEQTSPKGGPVRVSNPQMQARLEELKNNINTVKTSISMVDLQIERLNAQAGELRKKIAGLQERIEQAPLNGQQYESLMRDYTLAKAQYEDMVKRRDVSETANDLEEHKGGETLQVLDPPSLPEQPVEPNRPVWAAIGTVLGLFLGVMLAAAKEMKDTSLKNLKDVRAYTNLPVLSSIPLLENALLVRRKRRLFWLAWSSVFILGTMAMSGSVYYHLFGKS